MSSDSIHVKGEELPVKTGIKKRDREMLANMLDDFLASTYVLYAKTHAYHWNVTGPMFFSVHKLTDEQYHDLASAIDRVAERIRAIGFSPTTGLQTYLNRSDVEDSTGVPATRDMIERLAQDHQMIALKARDIVKEADSLNDVYTAELLTERIGVHEQAAWMLNALLVEQ